MSEAFCLVEVSEFAKADSPLRDSGLLASVACAYEMPVNVVPIANAMAIVDLGNLRMVSLLLIDGFSCIVSYYCGPAYSTDGYGVTEDRRGDS